MEWVYLLAAGLFEVGFVLGLKASEGLSRPVPSLVTLTCLGASLWLLSLAMRSLPLGTAYAVWTGIGTAGAVLAGMIMAREGVDPARVACVALILAGVVGLKLLER
ncbi:MAG: DMT family transporter [Niveispirillum sp.]|uniref:DMT family transporter n=1 Tax=Niveispirillum sp. TaxID=1917217 RepID=UPI003BA47DC0